MNLRGQPLRLVAGARDVPDFGVGQIWEFRDFPGCGARVAPQNYLFSGIPSADLPGRGVLPNSLRHSNSNTPRGPVNLRSMDGGDGLDGSAEWLERRVHVGVASSALDLAEAYPAMIVRTYVLATSIKPVNVTMNWILAVYNI